MKFVCLILPMAVFLLGCAEGGTGGTGGVIPSAQVVTVSGHANKGPFAEGASITGINLSADGQPGAAVALGITSSLGHYEVQASVDSGLLLRAEGVYFSETQGEQAVDPIRLEAVLAPLEGQAGSINLLTHVAAPRILRLTRDGTALTQAQVLVTDELRLALSSVVPAPAGAVDFANLGVLNIVTAEPDQAGNAYLLAVSVIFEQVVLRRWEGGGGNSGAESLADTWRALLDATRDDFAADGGLDAGLLSELVVARAFVNPDVVVTNLLGLDASFADALVTESGAFGSGAILDCAVTAGRFFCADLESDSVDPAVGAPREPLSFTTVVPNLNLFLDTDGDGLSNEVDTDDDGDGLADADDPLPYQ